MNTPAGELVAAIFQAGVAAADPFRAVQRSLAISGDRLEIAVAGGAVRTGSWSKIHLIAFGKAAGAMLGAAQQIIPRHCLATKPLLVTNYENARPLDGVEVIGAGHPLPDDNGYNAARRVAARLQQAQAGELVLLMISGGGSALLPLPVTSISLDDKIATTQQLLACGATIQQINCVRKHLSQLKGGGMARLAMPADLHALILSDVLGDDLSSIASGPTVADDSRFDQAVTILQAAGIWSSIPASVRDYLQQGATGLQAETAKPGDAVFQRSGNSLVGSNALSVHAVVSAAQRQGLQTELFSLELTGEARCVAEQLAQRAKCLQDAGLQRPMALIAGGETTVTLRGAGRGGRNQELALAFAIAAKRLALSGRWCFLSGGTDGRDGPTDAAGGLVDQQTLQRISLAGIDADAALANNDSYSALQAGQALLMTGATGTNVADLQILLLYPE